MRIEQFQTSCIDITNSQKLQRLLERNKEKLIITNNPFLLIHTPNNFDIQHCGYANFGYLTDRISFAIIGQPREWHNIMVILF